MKRSPARSWELVRVTLIWAARLLLEENIGSCKALPSSPPTPVPKKDSWQTEPSLWSLLGAACDGAVGVSPQELAQQPISVFGCLF